MNWIDFKKERPPPDPEDRIIAVWDRIPESGRLMARAVARWMWDAAIKYAKGNP